MYNFKLANKIFHIFLLFVSNYDHVQYNASQYQLICQKCFFFLHPLLLDHPFQMTAMFHNHYTFLSKLITLILDILHTLYKYLIKILSEANSPQQLKLQFIGLAFITSSLLCKNYRNPLFFNNIPLALSSIYF